MDVNCFIWFLVIATFSYLAAIHAQHEGIPYQNVQNICETCTCLTAQDSDKRYHHMISCVMKSFDHILARWPEEFGTNHNDIDIVASFSGNHIDLLQQLPATNASLTFACRHCGMKDLQAPTFMDVANIKRLDLSWNELKSTVLTPDVFRGPYRTTHYEPIALLVLDLSHNNLHTLDKKLFEHTPNLTELYLGHNKFSVLDNPTQFAIASASSLEVLDLSSCGLKTISSAIPKALINLKELNLAGNEFKVVPEHLKFVGKSLEILNMAGNQIERFTESSFLGLKSLRRLNISDNNALTMIENGAFTRLETLEYLHCSHNPKLQTFNLDSLMHCNNLTELDISYCGISVLTLSMELTTPTTSTTEDTLTNRTLPLPWPQLHIFETAGNPWQCDCALLQTLEYAGAHHLHNAAETRCNTPYILAGAQLSNLTSDFICSLHLPNKFRIVEEDPPRFLRKRYIILTIITAAVVIVLGLVIGFLVVCIRRRLKNDDFGIEPIRYTSVRSSNLSAFSHVSPANGGTSHA